VSYERHGSGSGIAPAADPLREHWRVVVATRPDDPAEQGEGGQRRPVLPSQPGFGLFLPLQAHHQQGQCGAAIEQTGDITVMIIERSSLAP